MMMKTIAVYAVLLAAGSVRAADLTEASEEAQRMSKLIRENPCYHDIELSVRSIQTTFSPIARPVALPGNPPPAAVRLYHDRACKMTGSPSAPRAERIYFDPEGGPWGLRLITARGSDETSVEVVLRTAPDEWRLNAVLGTFKTSDLLKRAVSGRIRLTMNLEAPAGAVLTMPHDVVIETIPYEHD